jgi:hypothetical protein
VLAAALVLSACKGREAERGPLDLAPNAPSAPPADQLRPGELAEGTLSAFGLPLPRRMTVEARFPDAVFAAGAVPVADVVGYVRERVVAERVEVEATATKTVFTGVTLKRAPTHTLRVEVTAAGERTSLVVRDQTRPPAKQGLSEEQRWRELGLTPQGEPLDPTQLE